MVPFHTVSRTVLITLAASLFGGCIAIPVSSKTIHTMIPKESLSFLEIGQTTKADVRKTLGKPWNTDQTDSMWVYELRAVSGRLAYCVAIPPNYGDCGILDDNVALILIGIDFDDSGVVTSWDEYKSDDAKLNNLKVIVYGSLEKRDGLLYEPRSTSPLSGIHSWRHDNGQLAGRISITHGIEDGLYTVWHVDGSKDTEQHYQGGKLNGHKIVWYKNGQKYTQDHYKDNQLHGLSTSWNPDGTVSSQMCFQNGEYSDLTPENCTPSGLTE